MMMHPTAQTNAEAPTWVWWDINRCPVPPDVDASLVGACIKSALKKLGYTGPLTINAIGRLTEVSEDVLRAVYSTGIGLNHVSTDNGFDLDLILWGWNHPTPANVLLISDYRIFGCTLGTLQARGYNVISPTYFASASVSGFDYIPVWQSLLAMLRAGEYNGEVGDKCSEKSVLVCSTCDENVKDFESFIKHLKSTEHARDEASHGPYQKIQLPRYEAGMMMPIPPKAREDAEAEAEAEASTIQKIATCSRAGMMIHPKAPTNAEAEAQTRVWWDITRCPVPADVDARMVGPCIKRALKKLGYTGPLTITAIGILTEVPLDVLRAIYSSGIALRHVPKGELEEEEDKCSETGEPALVCSTCDGKVDYVKDFESFITHLYSKEHGLKELQFYRHGCGSYEKEDATTIRHVLACFRAGIRSCQRKAEEELKAEDELKAQHVEHKKSRKR